MPDDAQKVALLEDKLAEEKEKSKALEKELKKQKEYAKGLLTQVQNLEAKEATTAPPRPVYGRSML